VNEEHAFIAALAAEPADRTTLLVYADRLDEQSGRLDPRAEGMRLLAAPEPNWKRIAELSSPAKEAREWVVWRCCGCGSVVRLGGGPFEGYVGQVVGVYLNPPDKLVVAVRILFLGGIIDHEVNSSLIVSIGS
jgi:uncharacterized protein (TIGR02996 family)